MAEISITLRKKGVWSQRFDACLCCQTTKRKHYSKGLCAACYSRAYRDTVKMRKDGQTKTTEH